MKALMRFFVTLAALALLISLNSSAASAQNQDRGRKTKTQPTTQQKQDRDMDRDQDRDKDRDQDRDKDRDRVSRPMTAAEKDMMMKQMMQNTNHIMAMGYRQNMLNFAQNLRVRLEAGGGISGDFARGAVKEIKRNFREMEKRHQSHKKQMTAEMREQMREMIQQQEEHHNRIRNTIRLLENDAKPGSPDVRQMLMHTRELEEQLRMMERAGNGRDMD